MAAHPELHPRSAGDRAADRRHLADKLAIADFAITQFFFDADDFLRMVDELDALGSTTPILPGIMPPGATPLSGLKRMAGMNGSVIPAALLDRLEAAADDLETRRNIAVEVATELSQRLLDAGVPGLHLYPLNRSEIVLRVVASWASARDVTTPTGRAKPRGPSACPLVMGERLTDDDLRSFYELHYRSIVGRGDRGDRQPGGRGGLRPRGAGAGLGAARAA